MLVKFPIKGSKIKLHERISLINEQCNVNAVLYYIKLTLIQAPTEAAVTLFLLEAYVIYTSTFTQGTALSLVEVIKMILIPVGGFLILCFIFLAISVFGFFNLVYNGIKTIRTCELSEEKYERIQFDADRHFKCLHVCGAVFYAVCGGLFPIILWLMRGSSDLDYIALGSTSFAMGALAGLFWNILGHYADKTILWDKIYYKDLKISSSIASLKLQCFICEMKVHIIIVSIILISCGYIIWNFNPMDIREPNPLVQSSISYDVNIATISFLITATVAIVGFYMLVAYKFRYHRVNSSVLYMTCGGNAVRIQEKEISPGINGNSEECLEGQKDRSFLCKAIIVFASALGSILYIQWKNTKKRR